MMTHQERVSILCEVLFECYTSVVVKHDSRTSTASAFIWTLAWYGQYFLVLQIPDCAKAFNRNCMFLFHDVSLHIQEEVKPSKSVWENLYSLAV